MDKAKFIQIAPRYYALAIAWHMIRNPKASRAQIRQSFRQPAGTHLLEYEPLFNAAARWLASEQMLDVNHDDFGPSLYLHGPELSDGWNRLIKDKETPFYKFDLAGLDIEWLNSALTNLNRSYKNLQIEPSDFENPDEQWKPLPLERNDPALEAAIHAIDDTLQKVLADNGYNVTFPEERNYVADGLGSISRTLKQATSTSVPYIQKYGLEPLAVLIRRFKDTAIAIVATAAKEAIIEFLKKHGVEWIIHLLGDGS